MTGTHIWHVFSFNGSCQTETITVIQSLNNDLNSIEIIVSLLLSVTEYKYTEPKIMVTFYTHKKK